ncbi:Bifunctional epoxide hydrolase 2 [Liparis tanakae]|uniref:Bifunctional epoxide hydrolase 2 n=1 Tax=Liparis tanakae TaxID=230148 RepID=A0A4Z2I8Q2_9TELE|nr:Bifunctional epoxide hydrolase 2 [Liparis tanakae]
MLTEADLQYYVSQYEEQGFRRPLNWYRNGALNWKWMCSRPIGKLLMPALMVTAGKDQVLLPAFSKGMEDLIPNLRRGHMEECGHWTQMERPAETNRLLVSWLEENLKRAGGVTVHALVAGVAAHAAVEGLGARVDALVPPQVGEVPAGVAARRALVGLLARVHAQVALEVVQVRGGVGAVGAAVGFLLRVGVGVARQVVGVAGQEGAAGAAVQLGAARPPPGAPRHGRAARRPGPVFGPQVQRAAPTHLEGDGRSFRRGHFTRNV